MARRGRVTTTTPALPRSSAARRRMLVACEPAVAEFPSSPAPEKADAAKSQATAAEPRFLPSGSSPGLAAIRELLSASKPVTWIFTGDSITHGGQHTDGTRCFAEHFAERVRWELHRLLDVVVNTGVSGGKSNGLLKTLDWRVLRFQPDVVSILIGMNDALSGPEGRTKFGDNLRDIVHRVQDVGAIPVLQTPNTVYLPRAETRFDLAAYVEIIRHVSETEAVPLVDHYRHWERLNPEPRGLLNWLSDESIHPGVYGHREMAKLICHEFGIFDPASPTCSRDVP